MTNKLWRKIPIYAGAGTVGSLFLGRGLRVFFWTWPSLSHGGTAYLAKGCVYIFIGWIILFVVAVYLYRDLSNQ